MKRKKLSLLSLLVISLTLGGCGTVTNKSSSEINTQVPPSSVPDSSEQQPSSSSSSSESSSASSSSSVDLSNRITYGSYICKEGVEDTSFLQGSPWLNTSIDGAIDKIEKPSEKDDFFANVNYEYLTEHAIPKGKNLGGGKIYDSQDLTAQRLQDMFRNSDDSYLDELAGYIKNGSHQKVKNRLISLLEADNDELKEMIDQGFLFKGPNRLFKICRTPGDDCPTLDVVFSNEYPSLLYAIYLSFYGGWSIDYAKYVQTLLYQLDIFNSHESVNFESFIRPLRESSNLSWDTFKISINELDDRLNHCEIKSILCNLGFGLFDEIKVSDGMLAFIDYIYADIINNETKLKKLMVDMAAMDSILLLGKSRFFQYVDAMKDESFSLIPEGFSSNMSDTEYAIKVIEHLFPEVLNVQYISKYTSYNAQSKLEQLVDQILDTYDELFDDLSWLSSLTKNRVKQKLNKMRYTVFAEFGGDGTPDDFDTSHVNENLLDTVEYYEEWYNEGLRYNYFNTSSLNSSFHAYTVNAAYSNADNTFMICHGIFSSFIDDRELSKEELYATAGFIIGHEISHAFDNTGSQFWDGQMMDWWEPNDKTSFQNKVNKLVKYLNTQIITLKDADVNGQNLAGEVIADMGSMRVLLRLIKKQNNFDLDAFFRYFAKLWSVEYTDQEAHRRIVEDEHAASFIRVNLTLVQFEEFRNLYDISEEDNMYIDNESVIAIW